MQINRNTFSDEKKIITNPTLNIINVDVSIWHIFILWDRTWVNNKIQLTGLEYGRKIHLSFIIFV